VTPKATPASDGEKVLEENVQELKERVESKVSELSKQTGKTVAGFVTAKDDKKITIDAGSRTIEAQIDADITEFFQISGTKSEELEAEDISRGDYILVTGPEIGQTVTANRVYKDEHYLSKSGKIIEVDADAYTIKVQTLEKDTYILDIERATAQQILDIKTLELGTAGFSKLKEGDNIHFVAKRGQQEDQTRYSAVKTVIIPQEYFIK
jgi:hypothetical protein